MLYTSGNGSNGLAVLVDSRTSTCNQAGGTLDWWGPGKRYIGADQWSKTLRIAIRDYKQPPLSAAALKTLKPELQVILEQAHVNTVLILQAPVTGGEKPGNNAWNLLGRPGNPYKWAGTVWKENGIFKCPSLHPNNYEAAYQWLIQRTFVQALGVAQTYIKPLEWPQIVYMPSKEMVAALTSILVEALNGRPVSIDIETNIKKTILSAIGLSCQGIVVSVPWDGYKIAGRDEYESAIESCSYGAQIKDLVLKILATQTPKIGQNFVFDKFFLQQRGYPVNGDIEDTLLLARTVYPQFRRGLQQVAALEFTVEPWKSFHKPPKPPKSVKKADYDGWLATPIETRIYNGKDAWITEKLFYSMKEKLT